MRSICEMLSERLKCWEHAEMSECMSRQMSGHLGELFVEILLSPSAEKDWNPILKQLVHARRGSEPRLTRWTGYFCFFKMVVHDLYSKGHRCHSDPHVTEICRSSYFTRKQMFRFASRAKTYAKIQSTRFRKRCANGARNSSTRSSTASTKTFRTSPLMFLSTAWDSIWKLKFLNHFHKSLKNFRVFENFSNST